AAHSEGECALLPRRDCHAGCRAVRCARVGRADVTSLRRRALHVAAPLLLLAARAGAQADSTAPDPLRFEGEVLAYEAADREWGTSSGAIVCVGSSTIASWAGTIERDLAPLPVLPRGFGGSTMLDALYYVDRLVLPYRPRAVLLYEGDNDVLMGM